MSEKTPEQQEFEESSAEMSAHCFEAGRLFYDIQLDEDALEKKRLKLRNMRVDFDKLNKRFQKALGDWQGQQREAVKAAQRAEELKANPTLELAQ